MIRDIGLFMVFMFIIAITIVVGYVIFDELNTAVQGSDDFNAQAKSVMADQYGRYDNTWDWGFLTIFIGVVIGICLISFALPSNPAFFFVIMLIVVLFGAVSGYLANVYMEFSADTTFGLATAQFPIMSYVLNHYPVFIIVTCMLMTIAFFAKPNEGYA